MKEHSTKFLLRNLICTGLLSALYATAQTPIQTPGQTPAKPKLPPHPADAIIQQEGYAVPPPALAEAVLAPRHENISLASLSPNRAWYFVESGDGLVSMAVMSKPFHELGGLFVDYKANRSRALTIRSSVALQFISAENGTKKSVQLPSGGRITNTTWSPDGNSVAFFVHTDDATHIWIADTATAKARQLTTKPVLATLVTGIEFTADGKQIITVLVPENRTAMPVEPLVATGPVVKLAEDLQKRRLRTYASLMSTPHEQKLFEWHTTGQVAAIDVATKAVRKIGAPKMVRSLNPSPDGKYLVATTVVKPFSYSVPYGNFGSLEEIWGADGSVLKKLNETPLNLGVASGGGTNTDDTPGPGGGANQQGRRELSWRHDGQGLTFLEQDPPPTASEGGRGDSANATNTNTDTTPQPTPPQGARGAGRGEGGASARRDKVKQWLPPFGDDDVKVIYEQATRMSGHRFSPEMNIVFFSERAGQDTSEIAVYLEEPSKKYTIARYRNNDIYAAPGTMLGTRTRGGAPAGARAGARGGGGSGPVLLSADGTSVFFSGTAYDKNPVEVGPKPFIDKVEIKTGEKTRIFEGDNNGVSERIASAIDPENGTYIIAHSTPREVTQFYRIDGNKRVQLTHNRDLFPDMTRSQKQRIMVERADGFKFRVNVTLPENYVEGTKLPAFFWFYPSEYATQEDYDRTLRTYNKNEFTNYGASAKQFFVRLGYAVIEPDVPIVGPTGQMNNNYPHDLRNTLSAIIDDLDARKIIDRTKLAIGGHSYGAFSTVNAMVQTPFFKAGIAGDGAYNRTLTPLGFQSERRDLWEARDVYLSMSPFLYANNMTGALLMYHGLFDQNVGTDPINSTRLYHALSGLGKATSLYMYPLEDHGPASKETVLDLWARWAAWLDKYVMNPVKPEAAEAPVNKD
ncbi:MAG: prolyl oligopeptidase family serine peptidase [Holophagaceae bacterium]|nr:prolyl oligopeptidase family serine peptidase [Holophagaceae bacterium]